MLWVCELCVSDLGECEVYGKAQLLIDLQLELHTADSSHVRL